MMAACQIMQDFHKYVSSNVCCCYLRVFENRVLRRIYGPMRDKLKGEWRKLHNEVLNDLYSSPNIIQVIKLWIMRWAEHVESLEVRRGADRVLVGKPEGKSSLGRLRHRWEDNIKMDIQDVGWGAWADWSASGWGQV
jgi:hypothetical protein